MAELNQTEAYHELENLNDISTKHRSLQDMYLTTKARLHELLPDGDTMLNSTMYPGESNNFEEKTTNNSPVQHGPKLPFIQIKPLFC